MNSSNPIDLRVPGLQRDVQLYVHGEQDKFVSRQLREEGIWEPYETSLLLGMLSPGDVFVDVGANVGYFSVLAATVVGDSGAVYAFEPDPDNLRLLEASARHNGLQHCINTVAAGLSDTAGAGELFLSEDNLGDHQIYADDPSRVSVPITLYHGSEYLRERIQRLDVLKVDTQGSEFQVMSGLLPLLLELPRPPRIVIELTPHSLRAAGASGRALIELLATLGQPMWIIEHLEHRLTAVTAEEMAQWCDNWDAVPESRGFVNILVGERD